jgi:hypothetical protein
MIIAICSTLAFLLNRLDEDLFAFLCFVAGLEIVAELIFISTIIRWNMNI